MPSCRICNKPLIWKKPYKKGDRPVENDGSIHDCSTKKENEDLKCIICDGSVGCPTCEFIEDCKPQNLSPLCICKKCEQLEDPFISYKKDVPIRYSKYNLSWQLLNRLRWDGTKIKSIIGSLAKTMHVSKSTFSTLYFPFLLYCIKNKKIDLEFDESLEEIVEKEVALIK